MRLNKGFIALLFFSFIILSCNEKVASDSDTKNEQTTQTDKGDASAKSSDHLLMYFSGLHPIDQRKLFRGLPAEMKYSLLIAHWNKQIAEAKNDEEKKFIQELINRLKPEYYSDSNLFRKEGAPFFDGLDKTMFTVFKNDTARIINLLYRIGGDDKAKPLTAANKKPDCECSLQKDWCIPGWHCGPADCTVYWIGCGRGLLYSCDGLCLYNES